MRRRGFPQKGRPLIGSIGGTVINIILDHILITIVGWGLRLLFQQLVQGFLHAAANQFLDLALDYFLV